MTIKINDLDGGIGNIITARGLVTGQEYIETYKRYLTQDKEKFMKYRYCLCDWTDIFHTDISNEDINTVVQLCKNASTMNPNTIISIVGKNDLIFGLGRMFEMLTKVNGTHWEIMVYRSIEEAKAWIRARIREKYGIDDITFG